MMFYSPDSRFNLAVTFLLGHEGKLSNHAKDPGGITNYGISLRFLKAAGIDIDADGDIDADDVKAIDREKATQIYREKWWDKYGFERLHSIEVAKRVFSFAVNMGVSPAIKILQRAIKSQRHSRIVVDGIMGVRTVAAANMCDEEKLVNAIKKEAAEYYTRIVANNPDLSVFLRGWLNRAAA